MSLSLCSSDLFDHSEVTRCDEIFDALPRAKSNLAIACAIDATISND